MLNADDPLVAAMAENVQCKVVYFSMNPDNPIIQNQVRRDGIAAVYEEGYLSILEGSWTLRIEQATKIPMTMGGMAPFMIANALAASLAAFVNNVDMEIIRQGVRTFKTSVEQTPGRMNLFNLGSNHALVDYAHNPAGYRAVGDFVKNWQGQRFGVVGGPGDRRDEDLIELGQIAAQVFDRLIVKEDDDKRGRVNGEAADLIVKGILQTNPAANYEVVIDETTAINQALDQVDEEGLVVVFPESVTRAIDLIKARNPIN